MFKKDEVIFDFSADKNNRLIQERNISFEEIIAAIADQKVLDVIEHPNKNQYAHQKMYIVPAKDYVYLVPFIELDKGRIFLKTILPSRKAKKRYISKEVN